MLKYKYHLGLSIRFVIIKTLHPIRMNSTYWLVGICMNMVTFEHLVICADSVLNVMCDAVSYNADKEQFCTPFSVGGILIEG